MLGLVEIGSKVLKVRRVVLPILSHIALVLLEDDYGTKRRPNSCMFKRNYSRNIIYAAAVQRGSEH